MAIEDGYIIGACLRKYFGDPTAALERYESIRRERTSAVVRKAHENRASVFAPKLANDRAIAKSVAAEWQQARVRERLDWLYSYDATAVVI